MGTSCCALCWYIGFGRKAGCFFFTWMQVNYWFWPWSKPQIKLQICGRKTELQTHFSAGLFLLLRKCRSYGQAEIGSHATQFRFWMRSYFRDTIAFYQATQPLLTIGSLDWHMTLRRVVLSQAQSRRAGHFRYFLLFTIIKIDFLHFLSS